ncbi:hypothetical protein AHiyo4_19590 [Arthrobacter sp. Hiyo4]|nr:hypothetical protein AHiyo4_19590 [Arthrobacter sp. Hiyo4]
MLHLAAVFVERLWRVSRGRVAKGPRHVLQRQDKQPRDNLTEKVSDPWGQTAAARTSSTYATSVRTVQPVPCLWV